MTGPIVRGSPDRTGPCSYIVSGRRLTRDVFNLLKTQNVHKACGPDGLSARILKECAEEFAAPLTKICLLSFQQGKFPTAWKRAHVIPVHKKRQ